jgi:hypothetical protein
MLRDLCAWRDIVRSKEPRKKPSGDPHVVQAAGQSVPPGITSHLRRVAKLRLSDVEKIIGTARR